MTRNINNCIRFIICHKPLGEEQLIDEAAAEPITAAPTAAWTTAAGITLKFYLIFKLPFLFKH
jgi:hypothetical protein